MYEHDSLIKELNTFHHLVSRILREQNIAFEVDGGFGFHPLVDQAFQATRVTTIGSLTADLHGPAIEHLDNLEAALMAEPVDGTGAIRCIFWAAENIFKQMFKTQLLGTKEIQKHLQPLIQAKHNGDKHALSAASLTLKGFENWVSACHNYRHEAGTQDPHQPPEELALILVSQGYGFVRWLAKMHVESLEGA